VPRNRKKLRKEENVCVQRSVLHLFLSYGPRAGPFWPAGWPNGPTGLTGRAGMGWRAAIRGLAHTFSAGLAGRPIG